MKVITITNGAIAINPQQVLTFGSGQIFEDGVSGVTDTNLKRMIELKFADEYFEDDETPAETADEVAENDNNDEAPSDHEFEAFTDKDELVEYAKELYGVDLDKRKNIKTLIEELKKHIETPVEETEETENENGTEETTEGDK